MKECSTSITGDTSQIDTKPFSGFEWSTNKQKADC